ncbi:FAD-dependent oxidoreductase [Luteolibacter sp. AS25]|uniref:FAD-dependent oxidoreductase n=1 Tax=Luteolibacter sp. AS25 TaxID=3135776 RepID=UPI00398A87FB
MSGIRIAVIGGGSAGICAAIAAARNGAQVTLLERSDQLGGMGTRAMVHTFCGLYNPDTTKPPEIANPGLPAEIESLMRTETGAAPVKIGKVYVLPQHPAAYAKIASSLTSAEKNLQTYFHTKCTAIDGNADGSFRISTDKSEITADRIIDTSADAIAANYLGATRTSSPLEIRQRSAFIFFLDGIPAEATSENFRMRLALEIVRAVKSNCLPSAALGTHCRASTTPGQVFFTTDLDPASPTDLLETGRHLAESLTTFLRNTFPEYKNCSPPQLAPAPGIRETYQWKGQYELTGKDLIEGTTFPDAVANATWPLELRETTRGPRLQYFTESKPSGIPLRSLVSSEIPDVYFAGRCISADHMAQASIRVMGTCFATGQAAGIAASRA